MTKSTRFMLIIGGILLLGELQKVSAQESDFLKEPEPPLADRLTWNWALTIDLYLFTSKDTASDEDDSLSLSLINDVILSGSLHFSEAHYLYVSGRNYVQWAPSPPNASGGEELSHAYDFQKLFFHTESKYHKILLGRDRFSLGSGIVYNNHADGINLELSFGGFQLQALATSSYLVAKDFDDFKKTIQEVSEGSHRVFAGGTLGYSFLNQNVYVGGLNQWDLTKYRANQFSNKISTLFLMTGANIVLWQGFFADAEFIYEMGKVSSYQITIQNQNINYNDNRVDIRAFAFDLQLHYYTKDVSQLNFLLQYTLASGDENIAITTQSIDKSETFNSFGQFNTGFAFSPKLKNIHIVRAGIAGNPFFFSKAFAKFYASLQYGAYLKYNKEGLVSDGNAIESDLFVGQGLDLFMIWKALGGVRVFAQAGAFIKGNAYPDKGVLIKSLLGIQLEF